MKTVGIIGGLGPQTTANFYMKIIMSCFKKNKESKPSILVSSIPISSKMEKNCILKGKVDMEIIPYLVDAAVRLEKGGADFIVIPCNTVHLFIDELRKSVNIPVLSIVEETTNFLRIKRIKEVGILATPTTIKNKLYGSAFQKNGIKSIVPNKFQLQTMGKIILNLVLNLNTPQDKNGFMSVIKSMENKGLNTFVLACTDLQILNPQKKNIKFFDTMEILANATVREILN